MSKSNDAAFNAGFITGAESDDYSPMKKSIVRMNLDELVEHGELEKPKAKKLELELKEKRNGTYGS